MLVAMERRDSTADDSAFLGEWLWPGVTVDSAAAAIERLAGAADALRLAGQDVRHLRSALIPADETLFCWFTAPSEAAVAKAAAQAGVRFDRILSTIDLPRRSANPADPASDGQGITATDWR